MEPNPYVGPRPFEVGDAHRFFGRTNETNTLVSLILANPAVLLYAQSGAGKSSLLNASILPLLQKRGCDVIGVTRVNAEGVQESTGNVYARSMLLSLGIEAGTHPQKQLYKLLRKPGPVLQQGTTAVRVVVLDQFEEIFTTAIEHWNERRDFIEIIGRALERNRRLRVVFSMREEYLARMDPYASYVPERLRTRFRLERLSSAGALDAMEKPLAQTQVRFSPGAAQKLVDRLITMGTTGLDGESGDPASPKVSEYVEPLHIQLVCDALWKSVAESSRDINESDVEQYGDVDQALERYYDDCIAQVVSKTSISERQLRRWFEQSLITRGGTRALVFQGDDDTAGMPNRVVSELERLYMVRLEPRGADPWYELTHDRFVLPIRRSNERWRNERLSEGFTPEGLEDLAKQWKDAGRASYLLLDSAVAKEAAGLLSKTQANEVDGDVREFVQASNAAAASRKMRSQRRLLVIIAGAAGALVTALVLVTVTFWTRRRQAEIGAWNAWGGVASSLSKQPGHELEALAYGIQAVAGPLGARTQPPRAAREGLADAVRAIGPAAWLQGNGPAISRLRVAPGLRFTAAMNGDTLRVYGVTGQLVHRLASSSGYSWVSLDFSPDGRFFVATEERLNSQSDDPDFDYRTRVFAAGSWREEVQFSSDTTIRDLQFSSTGVIALLRNKMVEVHDTGTGQKNFPAPGERSLFHLSADGTLLAVSSDSLVTLWNTITGRRVGVLIAPSSYVYTMISPNHRWAATLSFRGEEVTLWDVERDAKRTLKLGRPSIISEASFSKDSRFLSIILPYSEWQGFQVEVESGRILRMSEAKRPAAYSVNAGVIAVAVYENDTTRVTVRRPGNAASRFSFPGDVTAVAADELGSRVVTAARNGAVRVWDLADVRSEIPTDPAELLTLACHRLNARLIRSSDKAEYSKVSALCLKHAQVGGLSSKRS